jgi:hypothetical protein
MKAAKAILVLIMFLFLAGTASALQPKIVGVTDNLGNEWEVEVSDSDDTASVSSSKEIVVTDETEITLCITDVRKAEGDEVELFHETWSGPDKDDSSWSSSNNCNTWDMKEEHYQKDWLFMLYVRNQDSNYYHGSREADFRFQVDYENLKLPDETSSTTTESFDTTQISTSELEELRDSNEQKTQKIEELEDKLDSKEQKISEEQSQMEEKNSRISILENKVESLQQTIGEKNSTISNLRDTVQEKEDTISVLNSEKKELEANVTNLSQENEELRNKGIVQSITGFFFK